MYSCVCGGEVYGRARVERITRGARGYRKEILKAILRQTRPCISVWNIGVSLARRRFRRNLIKISRDLYLCVCYYCGASPAPLLPPRTLRFGGRYVVAMHLDESGISRNIEK